MSISDGRFHLDNQEHEKILEFQQVCGHATIPTGKYWNSQGFHDLPLQSEHLKNEMTEEGVDTTYAEEPSSLSREQIVSATMPFQVLLKGLLVTS